MDQDPRPTHEEISQWAAEFLKEATLEKKSARERNDRTYSRWAGFWKWLREYGTSVSIIVTIISLAVGAFWTANQFFIQQRQQVEQQKREAELRRQSLVVQFASDLGDKSKRNAAAYALAVLAREDAIPLLSSHLREAVKSDQDASFRDALTQAFITIGRSSLTPILDINRQATADSDDPKSGALILATQSVIVHFLKTDPKYLVDQKIELAGVTFRKVDLGFRDLSNLNFSKVRFVDSNFCSVNLHGVNLKGAVFRGSIELGSSDLEAANLDKASFSGLAQQVELSGANLNRVTGDDVEFDNTRMDRVSMSQANLNEGNFTNAVLEFANLSEARLYGSRFSGANLFYAKLVNAFLADANFQGANLQNADFSGADLGGTKFFMFQTERPHAPSESLLSYAALVSGANFDHAKNLSDDTRVFLCRWGALNVPGGCAGISREKFDYQYHPSSLVGSCW